MAIYSIITLEKLLHNFNYNCFYTFVATILTLVPGGPGKPFGPRGPSCPLDPCGPGGPDLPSAPRGPYKYKYPSNYYSLPLPVLNVGCGY